MHWPTAAEHEAYLEPVWYIRRFSIGRKKGFCLPLFVGVSNTVKRYHDHNNSYKRKYLTGAGLRYRGLVHHHHDIENKANMVLEKKLRVLHFDLKATGSELCPALGVVWTFETSKSTPTVTHLFQQGYTYSQKATPPNSATPYLPRIETHESMGAVPVQTTTLP